MTRFLRTMAIAAVSMALVAPMAEAQGRGGNGGRHGGASAQAPRGGNSSRQAAAPSSLRGGSNATHSQARPATSFNRQAQATQQSTRQAQSQGRPVYSGNNKPNHQPGTQPGGNKPGGNQPGYNNGGNRPGHQPGGNNPGGNRPGGNKPGGNRPGGNQPNFHPNHGGGVGHGPGHGPNGPGHGPSARPHGPRPGMTPPPPRPGRPVFHHWSRPVPPPAWRPGPRAPFFRTFLGIAIGATVQATMDALWNGGYYVTGYDNGMVYINDVNELGFFWPNAVMMYDNYGGLCGTQYYYQTPYNDTYRFQSVYNTLCRTYGYPQVNTAGNAVWYGRDGSYISLTYGNRPSTYGPAGFYTTLTFGN